VISLLSLFLCPPVAIILFVISRSQVKRMTIHAPLCERHRHYWAWRTFWITVPLLVLVAVVIALVALLLSEMIADNAYYLVLLATIFLLMVWAATAWYLSHSGIRAVEITDYDITLDPVSNAFAELVRDDRIAKKGQAGPDWEAYDPYPRAPLSTDPGNS